MPFVIVYARASRDPKEQKISVDRQVKLGTVRAHELWPAAEVRVFRDDAITAADPGVYRPGFARVLAALRAAPKGECLGIVVNEQSRLTRQGTRAWDHLVVTLTKAGVTKVETLRAGPVSVEPGNRLVGRILAVVDAEEVERTKARVQDAHRELFREGRPTGRAPFGYRPVKDRDGRPAFEPDPDESPIVKQVFAWALQGHAISVITVRLNTADVLPRSARFKFKDERRVTTWQPTTVRKLLASPTVAGLRAHTDAEGQVHTVPAKWDHIVDPETWRRVQRMLGRPSVVTGANGETYRVRTKPRPQPRKYLLSGGRRRSGVPGQPGEMYGVLRCGKCDRPLVAQTQARPGGVRISAYACHPKADPDACGGVSISPADKIEATVVAAIQAELAANAKLRGRLTASADADADRWRAERDAAKTRMLDASSLLGAGTIDRDSFDAMHGAAKTAYDAADARLATVATDLELPSVADVTDGWETLTLVQQRAVVERLIERIVVDPGSAGRSGFNRDRLGMPVWRM